MPFSHTPRTMMPDNQGVWFSRSEVSSLISENNDLKGANRLLHKELKTIRGQIAELVAMMKKDRQVQEGDGR